MQSSGNFVAAESPSCKNAEHDRPKRVAVEPIAIVGMACRFPGADSVEAFWRLLMAGENAVVEGVPGSGEGRIGELFPDADVQNQACRFGGYLEGLEEFDAAFFRISPVEAQLLDPQQRLMLETSWQALEDAAIDPEGLKGSRTGVYGGISNNDYRGLILNSEEINEGAASLYAVSGTSYNTAIGRVAYALGFRGPAVAIDTACSSSLVAIHQAVSGLQLGEADLALAGGVHTIHSGRLLEMRGNAGMLSPDGRCFTFDASANGYVRGEGCGILVLKRLNEAERDGDRIWGVIRGSALNQDGASQGLTVPSAEAQQTVIGAALARAGVSASEVDYVEAHGTGTPVGDPIEMEALGAAFGPSRDPARPLLVGSVKTNFGHLEAAAGVAGMMKAVLALKHGVIPKHRNFSVPNPDIDWANLPVKVTSEATEWPEVEGKPPIAGVSGFGWSGTNAHVVLEGYEVETEANGSANGLHPNVGAAYEIATVSPVEIGHEASPDAAQIARSKRLLPLSGKTPAAVEDLAQRYLGWLDSSSDVTAEEIADAAWTASVGRGHFEYRAGVTFDSVDSLRSDLQSMSDGEGVRGPESATKVAYVYTGQGSQWLGMGESLYRREPVVRAVLDRCDEVIREERGESLLDVMFGRPGVKGNLHDTAWTQPAVYALECALTALWSSVGVEPSVVIGHSLGEFAAAHKAGVFSMEDGLRFVAKRGSLLGSVPELGGMAAIFAPKGEVAAAVEEHNASSDGVGLCVAVDNGVHQVVSGPVSDVEAISGRFEADEVRVRVLRNQAFHSALVEPALDELEEAYRDVKFSAPELDLISNVTGRVIGAGDDIDGKYWRRHARNSVEFQTGIDTMAELGVDLVIEVGPNAVLGPLVSMAWPSATQSGQATKEPSVLASLLRNYDELPFDEYDDGFVAGVAGAYEAGLSIRFEGLFAGESRRRISLPSYAFQRERYWVEAPRRKRVSMGHPLLGERHESPRGEVLFETEMFPSDPAWLSDHRVFGRVIMPGALYGAMAVSAALSEGAEVVEVEDLQLHSPMVFAQDDPDDAGEEAGRRIQLVLDESEDGGAKRFEIYSQGDGEEGWTLHAEGKALDGDAANSAGRGRFDIPAAMSRMTQTDTSDFYQQKASLGIDFGSVFHSVQTLWTGEGEAIGEVSLSDSLPDGGIEAHPVLIDGCFQVLSAARSDDSSGDGTTYLPFGWQRMWLMDELPDRLVCHARMRERLGTDESDDADVEIPETFTGDLRLYTVDGVELGGFDGYTVKRATRATLLAGSEDVEDLLYEVVWRDKPLATATVPADFLPKPADVFAASGPFTEYMADLGVDAASRSELLADLERLSWSYALLRLQEMGWEWTKGETIDTEELSQRFDVLPEHARLFRRIFELLGRAGIVEESDGDFVVVVGPDDPLPDAVPVDPDEFATEMLARYDHGQTEVGLFVRCVGELIDVLKGDADPLTVLFGSGSPSAADLYISAPAAAAANRMLAEAVTAMVEDLPDGRRLRILEVGAGTGSATASVLPVLPSERYDYVYTDISAGFFAEAENRFGGVEASIDYRVLDIEKSPVTQGFDAHSYDIVIASNVLHATRFLGETLANCLEILAPSGLLVALENMRPQGWMDLTFGSLDGWWRFADEYRPLSALSTPDIWERGLTEGGFDDFEFLGVSDADERPDRGVIVAQGPQDVSEPPGVWVLMGDQTGVATDLAAQLRQRDQTVIVVNHPAGFNGSATFDVGVESDDRESWRNLFENLPAGLPVKGVVHLAGLDGSGVDADNVEFAGDAERIGSSALAMIQGIGDADVIPANGVWFITRGAQVLERERSGEIAGSLLWGLGKVVDREASHLNPRMIDLDPAAPNSVSDLLDELLHPDTENHIACRYGLRLVSRLNRFGEATGRVSLPSDSPWVLKPDEEGVPGSLSAEVQSVNSLEPGEVRVAVEAVGVNFRDAMVAMGMLDDDVLGGEVVGRVVELGADVSEFSVGDRVVGLCFRSFASEVVTRAELLAHAPCEYSSAALATMPLTFTTVALSFEMAKLKAGDKVLIHSGAGGVGLSAIQMAQAAGAEVFATASIGKHDYLRSLGVKHVFDSRRTEYGEEILEATDGKGVNVLLNSFVGEDFLNANVACLAKGGRWIELAAVGIFTEAEMAAVRPDVEYAILQLDELKTHDPEVPGKALRQLMERVSAGELRPIAHSRWPMAEAASAVNHMRSARHIGKLVLTNSPMVTGELRADRTYLVTGGLGGIGSALAGWLAGRGAGAIVLNGRRDPDPEVLDAINSLRQRGVTIEVAIADVTDAAAVEKMLDGIDEGDLPLGGVIHSVGVLSDAALTNQSWESFERVLWPKVLGAWHLHRATLDRDLDLFVLFSSVAGVLGNSGQANHSAANAFLDQLAGHRRALGLPGQSIAWGAWSGLGEAEEHRERIAEQLEAVGTGWMTPEQGFDAFEALVQRDVTNALAAVVDWPTFAEGHDGSREFLEDLISEGDEDASQSTGPTEDLLTRLKAAEQIDRAAILTDYLQEELRAVMRLQSMPSATVGFFDLGMDSLMAVEFRNRLNRSLAGEYVASNTIVFDFPNVADLAQHLADELDQLGEDTQVFALPAASAVVPETTEARRPSDVDGIAIVGMACRFPGARNLDEFWSLLATGGDAIADGRPDNGALNGVFGSPYLESDVLRRGGFIDEIDQFDSRFFRISPLEARSMDPQQRMMLETAWHALEDAGIDPDTLKGSRTGVYVGVGTSEYRDVIAASGFPDNYLGTTASMVVGRVAYVLGLEGPAIPVDLVCASSHASIHQAVQAVGSGEVDMALAGGVNAALSIPITEFMTDLGMLSSTGRSKPFDADADGFVRGEGCGMLVLKRLRDAEADGDRIWGVIIGSAVNQNGASAGLTVPNGSAQQRVMQDAVDAAGIDPGEVDYYEAHGGASQLGDPIELHAAGAVYGEGRDPDHPLLVGSVKANLGHLERAAGVASVIKVALAMKNGVMPKQLNFDEPNPHVDWDRLPMKIPTESTGWNGTSQRAQLAAISGFGMSGANANLVLAGYGGTNGAEKLNNGIGTAVVGDSRLVEPSLPDLDGEIGSPEESRARVLPLSARSEPALRDMAKSYLDWVDDQGGEGKGIGADLLADMAWTSGSGRSHMGHRAGVVFDDADSLREGLRAVAARQVDSEKAAPDAPRRVAFAFSGGLERLGASIEPLYQSEPVIRSVMDGCNEAFEAETGSPLWGGQVDLVEGIASISDPIRINAMTYAIEVAMASLWASLGVKPNVVLGEGVGQIAAAQVAQVFNIEDGLKLAIRYGEMGSSESRDLGSDGFESAFDGLSISEPSIGLVSGATGERVGLGELTAGEHWSQRQSGDAWSERCSGTLGASGVDAIVGVGLEPETISAFHSTIQTLDGNGLVGGKRGFASIVARAYEMGLAISFSGLFVGETRRRIGLPQYPFQRRRHWV